jgi:hypothetical protein
LLLPPLLLPVLFQQQQLILFQVQVHQLLLLLQTHLGLLLAPAAVPAPGLQLLQQLQAAQAASWAACLFASGLGLALLLQTLVQLLAACVCPCREQELNQAHLQHIAMCQHHGKSMNVFDPPKGWAHLQPYA